MGIRKGESGYLGKGGLQHTSPKRRGKLAQSLDTALCEAARHACGRVSMSFLHHLAFVQRLPGLSGHRACCKLHLSTSITRILPYWSCLVFHPE